MLTKVELLSLFWHGGLRLNSPSSQHWWDRLFCSWINGFAQIPFAQLPARGRPDLVAKCHWGKVLPYFGALYLGLHFFGVVGAAAVIIAALGAQGSVFFYLAAGHLIITITGLGNKHRTC